MLHYGRSAMLKGGSPGGHPTHPRQASRQTALGSRAGGLSRRLLGRTKRQLAVVRWLWGEAGTRYPHFSWAFSLFETGNMRHASGILVIEQLTEGLDIGPWSSQGFAPLLILHRQLTSTAPRVDEDKRQQSSKRHSFSAEATFPAREPTSVSETCTNNNQSVPPT